MAWLVISDVMVGERGIWVVGKLLGNFLSQKCLSKNANFGDENPNFGKN